MSRRRSTLETEIQRRIEAEIGSEPDLLILRNSVGKAKFVSEENGREYHVPYGLGVGSPDLVGMLRVPCGDGIGGALAAWFCLEIKADEGELDPEQEKTIAIWRSFGALVYVVRSPGEARSALECARDVVRARVAS